MAQSVDALQRNFKLFTYRIDVGGSGAPRFALPLPKRHAACRVRWLTRSTAKYVDS
jgi:hypothetical protein